MSLIEKKHKAAKEEGVSTYFPITHLLSPSIFETQTGMLGTVIKVKGFPYVTASEEELNHYQRQVHQALLKLDHDFILYETKVRRKKDLRLEGEFNNPFAAQVNQKYHQRFNTAELFINEIYLTLIYKNNEASIGKTSIIDKVIQLSQKLSDKAVKSNLQERREAGIKKLNHKSQELMTLLSNAAVKRLGERDKSLSYSELLAFLSLVPNGGMRVKLSPSIQPMPICHQLKDISQTLSLYPQGHLGHYLCNHRLYFGDNIQFEGLSAKETRFAAILSLKQYGAETANVIFDPLLNLEAEFILTQSYSPIDSALALKEINRAHGLKVNADDLAHSQLEELGLLADLVSSDKLRCGYHHNSLMLFANDQASLDKLIHEASKAYSLANLSLSHETLAQIPAFFAQIPGNGHFIPRISLITSENFADFISLHNAQTGHHQENFLNSAITLLETPSKTPVFFNYHAKGSKTNPSKGHSLVIGGNDSGKTTAVSFFDSQMMRFNNHRAIFLDRNKGLKIYILAMAGKYIELSPENNHCLMNPLRLEDTPKNRDFNKAWFQALLLREGESSLNGYEAELCNEVIDYAFDTLEPSSRNLTNISAFLPIDFERWPELRRWLKGSESRSNGQYAWLFDNEEDAISLDTQRIGFDITYVLDSLSPEIATPIFMYIMQRIELCLDGHLTSIVIDEMWQVLRAPYWQRWLAERLPSIRKENGHIIGMTQSPKTIVESPLSAELLDNIASLILFPNPKADPQIYIDKLGLSPTEFQLIKNNNPESRLFLYKHESESIICKLDLGNLSDEIRVFSGNKSSVALAEKLINQLGAQPDQWLPQFINRSQA